MGTPQPTLQPAPQILNPIDVPARYRDKGFKDFKGNTELRKRLQEFAVNPQGKQSLLLFGGCGVGKTHLAVAIIKNINKFRRQRCTFYVADELYTQMNQVSYDHQDKTYFIKKEVERNAYILLDDLRFDNFTPAKSENLYLLINTVYLQMKNIIISTNETPDSIRNKVPAVFDRLVEMASFIEIKGESYRGKIG